ncbi:MAG: DNA polymerase I, partial [Gemmatimonadetes bacterium]|nr:DNA polymerase I [Gemmatimonadota bacterium]
MVEKPEKTRPRLFLIDGYALIYRAFFALISRPLTSSRGENTSAAFGFTRFLLKILEEHEPDYLGVVMDAGTSARELRYPAYKATRDKMPDELRSSLGRIRQLLEAFRVPVLELLDYEADDVIGTLATRALAQGLEAVIVSGDKDFYQLIRPGICLLNPGRGGPVGIEEEWVDVRNASARLGVPPERVADYLALIGDSSDNIPGARGIGPKTAVQLIQSYGPVEDILARAPSLDSKRAREALLASAHDVRLSKELVTIRTDLPIELDLGALAVKGPDRAQLRQVLLDLEFHSLVREYAPPEEKKAAEQQRYRVVASAGEVRELVQRARAQGSLALHVEGTATQARAAEIVGIGFALAPGVAFYLPFGHRPRRGLALAGAEPKNLPAFDSEELRPLRELLADARVAKIGHDLKHDLLVLRRAGVELAGLAFDSMIASYVLNPGRREHGLDSLALEVLDHKTMTYADLCGKGKEQIPLAQVEVERAGEYFCQNADLALRLADTFREELERFELLPLLTEMEMPLVGVLADMEWAG